MRTMSGWLAAVIVTGLLAMGCSAADQAADNSVTGVVTEITGDVTVVESFVVLDDEGSSHLFRPAPGLLFYGGPLSHLRDHVLTGQRVRVTFETGAYGELTATLVEHEDADEPHEPE